MTCEKCGAPVGVGERGEQRRCLWLIAHSSTCVPLARATEHGETLAHAKTVHNHGLRTHLVAYLDDGQVKPQKTLARGGAGQDERGRARANRWFGLKKPCRCRRLLFSSAPALSFRVPF